MSFLPTELIQLVADVSNDSDLYVNIALTSRDNLKALSLKMYFRVPPYELISSFSTDQIRMFTVPPRTLNNTFFLILAAQLGRIDTLELFVKLGFKKLSPGMIVMYYGRVTGKQRFEERVRQIL